LTEAGHVIARSTVQHSSLSDVTTDAIKTHVHTFDANLIIGLNDDDFTLNLPNHVFYLQDNDHSDDSPQLWLLVFPLAANTGYVTA
jgi:hypothetical protein